MKINARIALTITCLLLVAIGAAGPAAAACSNATLKGSYGLIGLGSVMVPPNSPVTGPVARVGLFVFDGAGSVSANSYASYNGLVFNEPYKGTYTVKSDCTLTFKVSLPEPVNLPAIFRGAISDEGRQVDLVLCDPPGTAIAATFTKQPKAKCQTSDLFGTYSVRASGSLVAPNPLAGPFARIGTFQASGDQSIFAVARKSPGTFTITADTSYNGDVKAEAFSGSFDVDPDCMVHFKYTQPSAAGPVTSTFDGMLVNENKQVIFVMTTESQVISGSLTRQ